MKVIEVQNVVMQFPELFYCATQREFVGTRCGYEVPGTERDHIRSISLELLWTWLNDTATVGNIFGTPVVE